MVVSSYQAALMTTVFLFFFLLSRLKGNCPMIHIPGFTYPVQEYLLEDVVEMLRLVRLQTADCMWEE